MYPDAQAIWDTLPLRLRPLAGTSVDRSANMSSTLEQLSKYAFDGKLTLSLFNIFERNPNAILSILIETTGNQHAPEIIRFYDLWCIASYGKMIAAIEVSLETALQLLKDARVRRIDRG